MSAEISQLEAEIIELALANDCAAEVCNFVEYEPSAGRVPGHWRVRHYIMVIVEAIAARRDCH